MQLHVCTFDSSPLLWSGRGLHVSSAETRSQTSPRCVIDLPPARNLSNLGRKQKKQQWAMPHELMATETGGEGMHVASVQNTLSSKPRCVIDAPLARNLSFSFGLLFHPSALWVLLLSPSSFWVVLLSSSFLVKVVLSFLIILPCWKCCFESSCLFSLSGAVFHPRVVLPFSSALVEVVLLSILLWWCCFPNID